MDQYSTLVHGPYGETVSIPLSENPDSSAPEFDRDTELIEMLEEAPDDWTEGVKSYHTNFREMDRTISARSLSNKLTDLDYCRSVMATLPPVAIQQLKRILRNTADCSSQSLIRAFAGHSMDQFWLSPDNPGWALLMLKNAGIIFPESFSQSDVEYFVPSDIRENVQKVVDDPPDSKHQFPVPKSEHFRLRLPGKSYFSDLTSRIIDIKERLLAGESIPLDDESLSPFLNDPFKKLLLFVGLIGDEDTAFRSLKKPVGRFVNRLVTREDCSELADLLVEVMFAVPGDVHFIVGKNHEDKVQCRLWNTLRDEYFGSGNSSPNVFCLGEFCSTRVSFQFFHSFQQRFALLVPLILYESSDPVQRALDWIHESAESNPIVHEPLPSGILRWVNHGPHELDQDQALTILREGIDHRRSGIRRKAYRVMRDCYPEEFQEVLPKAKQDDTKKVREWAEKQDRQLL
ncbi:MAG: hypothetical protein ABEJ65_02425 [bacterium]